MVEWKYLGDLCEIKTGKGITQKDCTDDGEYPVISGGQSPMGLYCQFNREANTVTISRVGAYAGYVSFIDKKFYLNDKCFSIIPFKHLTLHSRYLYIVLKSQEKKIKKLQSEGGVPTINTQKLAKLQIPIPSLSEQSRIVSILDTFTASIENLKEQIAERRKQYEYQRDQLLDLEGKEGVEMKKLGEIIQVKKGEYITKKEAKEGIYPVILGGKEPAYYIDKYNHTGKAMVMSRSGASAGYVSLWNEPIFVTDGFLIEPRGDVVFEYLYYTLKSKQGELHGSQKGGAIPHVTPASIGVIQVRLPNISVQSRIVSILDTFEASIANLEAQLELRQKQYEYYRNQLLTFE